MKTLFKLYLIIGLLIHSTFAFSQSEKIDTILIKRQVGKGEFNSAIQTSSFRIDDEDRLKYIGMPKGMDTFRLTFKPFDVKQYYYDRFKRGTVTLQDMKKRFNDDIDTLLLSKDFIKHRVGVYSGLKGKNKVIIVDANNNFDFSDDKVLEFDTTVYFKKKLSEVSKKEPSIDLKYEIFYDSKVLPRISTVKILPYSETFSFKDEMDKKLIVYINSFSCYKTVLDINGKSYCAELNFDDNMALQSDEMYFLPIDSLKSTNIEKENFIFKTNEKFVENGNIFSIFKISRFADTLFLKNWGKGEYVEGNKLGMRSLPFCKQSIEDLPICSEKLKGKYVLIDFWGTWCGPCIASIPDIKKIRDTFSENDLEIISVAADNNLEKVKMFIKERGMNWTHLQQEKISKNKEDLTSIFNVFAFPTTILIDEKGLIVDRGSGSDFVNELYDKLKKMLK